MAKTIIVKSAWEKKLQALNALMAPAAGDAVEQRDQRMAWLLFSDEDKKGPMRPDCDIEPRLQVINKSGKWSKGRKVALKRLIASGSRKEEFPFLTVQDQAILAHMVQREESTGYYRYTETVTELDAYDALPDLIDHPLLFINDMDTPLSIAEGKLVLKVVREKSNIRISIDPHPKDEERDDRFNERSGGTTLLWDTPQRLSFYRFSWKHLRVAKILGKRGVSVPEAAKDQALASVSLIAPLLTVHSEIGGDAQVAAKTVEADTRLHLHLMPLADGLQISCFVRPFADSALLLHPGEGGKTLFTERAGETLQTQRNMAQEMRLAQQMFNRCAHLDAEMGWNWQLDDPQQALETLEQLQMMGDNIILEWPEGKSIKLAQRLDTHQFAVSIRKQQEWFQVDGELQLDDEQVLSIKQLLSLVEASPGRFVRLKDDQFLCLSQALYQRLNRLRMMTNGGRFHGLAAGAVDEVTEGMKIRRNKHWQDQLQKIADAEVYQPQLPSTLQAELRDYQLEGFRWMARLTHWGAGACLADDMGLGKTVQALALILSQAEHGPTLVVAPTSVCMNWQDEVARFAPTLRLHNFAEGGRQSMVADVGPFDLVVCSYALLQRNEALLAGREWQTIVLDEAQAIKNATSKRAKAAVALNGKLRLITTGTPIENHLGELWSLFQFINPGLLGSLEQFNHRFANPIQQQQNSAAAKQLKQLVRPFILRRLKSDVLTELPLRTEITLHVELSKEEIALYEAVRQKALERIQASAEEPSGQQQIKVLAEIMRLRRACCHPSLVMPDTTITGSKLEAFAQTIHELREGNHKALVFSQFVAHLTILRNYLDKEGIPYQYLDGSTPAAQRKQRVDAFQAGEGDVFLISLKAGGVGLNLTAADYVLHMDPWWNPAVEDQASDRAHRIGQKRPVTIYRFIAKHTIEDKIVQMHHQKRDLAETLLEGSDVAGKLSLQQIVKLVEAASLAE